MRHRVGMAIVCLHLSAVLYVLLGVGLLVLVLAIGEAGAAKSVEFLFVILMFLMCLALAIAIEFVVHGLHYRKKWAWIVGIVMFGIYLPSLFFPLGALGLWGLLDAGSQAEFGVGSRPRHTPFH